MTQDTSQFENHCKKWGLGEFLTVIARLVAIVTRPLFTAEVIKCRFILVYTGKKGKQG